MCRFLRWDIQAARPAGGAPLPAGIVSIAPALRHERMPPEVGILLPSTDTNHALLSALDDAPGGLAGLAVGLFLSDPFLNVGLAIRRLRRAGVTWICALPSACQHEPEFRQYLREVDLDLDRERRVLDALSQAGFDTIATAASADDDRDLGAAPSATFALPDVGRFVGGYPSLAARQALEGSVAATAPAGATLRLGARLTREREETAGLDGIVLRPVPLELRTPAPKSFRMG